MLIKMRIERRYDGTPKKAANCDKAMVENNDDTEVDEDSEARLKPNKLAKLRRHASRVHFAKIHFG